MKGFNKQSGEVSKTLIILAVVVLLAVVLVYILLKYSAAKNAPVVKTQEALAAENEPPKPVYETTIGDIRFLFDSAIDLGPVVKAPNSYQQDLVTTEKFVYVTIRAQNKGKSDTARMAWDIGSIVDADGRNFIEDPNAYYFLPRPNLCGEVLKPEFEPTPCVKMYQVSKVSDHLKIEVKATNPKTSKIESAFLDLDLR